MFRFGWLTIAPDDLAIWAQFPDAAFTLVQTPPLVPADEADETPGAETGELHLGAFELHTRNGLHGNVMRSTDERPVESQSSV
jgi:hypothetical protein